MECTEMFLFIVAFLSSGCGAQIWSQGIVLMTEEQFRELLRNMHPLAFQWSGYDHLCYPKIGCFDRNTGAMRHVGLLPHSPEEIGTRFEFYTRKNPHEPMAIISAYEDNEANPMDYVTKFRPVVVIIHGWHYQTHTSIFAELISAFLEKMDANIILVNWSSGTSHIDYISCAVNTEIVGRQVAVLLRQILLGGVDEKDMHLVGFSLGGQIAGFAGKYAKTLGFFIGRISALDPAGFLFEQMNSDTHLTKDDAHFVDVLHTDANNFGDSGSLGMIKPAGHADFYPNGGKSQPGCGYSTLCSHFRSVYFYLSTMKSNCSYTAYPCDNYEKFLRGRCFNCEFNNSCGTMGFDSIKAPGRGRLYLKTTAREPYCSVQTVEH